MLGKSGEKEANMAKIFQDNGAVGGVDSGGKTMRAVSIVTHQAGALSVAAKVLVHLESCSHGSNGG